MYKIFFHTYSIPWHQKFCNKYRTYFLFYNAGYSFLYGEIEWKLFCYFYLLWVQICTVCAFISVIELPRIPAYYPKTLKLNPDGDFLFMKDGQPIYADSFNEHLKNKVCKPLNIPYRSSHQIRFTITTMLYEAGVPLNQLSTMLGHSETRTTLYSAAVCWSKIKHNYD